MAKLSLTAERKAIIDDAYAEWLAVGLSTEPAKFNDAERAIADLYASIGKKRPNFVRLSSPFGAELYINLLTKTWPKIDLKSLEGQLEGQLWSQLEGQLGDQLRGQLRGQLWSQLRGQLRDRLWDQLWDQLRGQKFSYMGTWFSGQWDYLWSWAETGRRLGVKYPDKLNAQLNAHCAIMRSCGWFYPFNDFCIVTDRPEIIARDDRNRLHSVTRPSLRYRDGYSLFAWHGVRVPGEWITNKESVTPKIALTHPNIEQRRAACEIVGWDRILTELKAKTIDKDEDPMIGELVEVNIPDVGKEKFLRVLCGTGRNFALPVPPQMKTALEANSWTYAVDTQVLKALEART